MQLNAQLINVNPEPNGPPWWVGGVPEITPETQAKLNAIPVLQLSNASKNTTLPPVVDNSKHKFMRPIFKQDGGCCAQAAGVAYTFTYEVNRLRNLAANNNDLHQNQYPTHYTWNFLNNGYGSGSWYFDGWDIIKENGCPNITTWHDTMSGDMKLWMSDYDRYYQGMHNKTQNYHRILYGNYEGLNTLKHWLNDHGNGETTGGLACFAVHYLGNTSVTLPEASALAGKKMIIHWGTNPQSGHAMTFVGYNDSIMYDFNGDGQYTTDYTILNNHKKQLS